MAIEQHPLTKLPRALIEAGYQPTTYKRAWNATVNGCIPAMQSETGRWTYAPADLPVIADALGLSHAAAA